MESKNKSTLHREYIEFNKRHFGFDIGDSCWIIKRERRFKTCSECDGNGKIELLYKNKITPFDCPFCDGGIVETVPHYSVCEGRVESFCCTIDGNDITMDIETNWGLRRVYDFKTDEKQLPMQVEDYAFNDIVLAKAICTTLNSAHKND